MGYIAPSPLFQLKAFEPMAGVAGAGSHAKPNRRVTLLSYWWLPFVKPYRDNPFERETYDVAGGSNS